MSTTAESTRAAADPIGTAQVVNAPDALVGSSINQALMQITKGEIDQQIASAHQYPRSISRFQKRALEMVTLDEETAESCLYSRPVGRNADGSQKFAEGMSIRMAEIVGACYGNLRVGAMLVEMTERYVKARGFAHDLESNFASTSEVVESTVDRNGRPYSERQRVVVAKAALAKARRDATFSVVPKALCKRLESDARQTAIGDATTLAKRRGAVLQWVAKLGIDPARVFAALNVTGEADIGLDQLTTLTGMKTAIKDGDTTVDEAFPPLEDKSAPPAQSTGEAIKERLRQKQAPGPAPEDKPKGRKKDDKAAPKGDSLPFYSPETALAELRGGKTMQAVMSAWAAITVDYHDSGRVMPDDVLGTFPVALAGVAIDELRAARSVEAIDALWKSAAKAFRDYEFAMPIEVEAVYNECREVLEK